MSYIRQSWYFLLTVLVLFAAGGALAGETLETGGAETKNAWRMGEVVVTATRDVQEVQKVPANVTVITSEEIEKAGATSVADVLTGLAGINVSSYSGNASQSIVDMRGFGTEAGYLRHVVLLDGRRLNRPDIGGINWLEIPLSEIDRIEIVRGPGSVLYGDAAIAGVINIITKRGEGRPKGNLTVISGSYDTYDGRVSVRGSADKLYYALNGEGFTSGGYRDRSDFTTASAGGSIGYNPTDKFDASLGITYNKTDNEFPGALTKEQLHQDRRQAQYPDDDAEAKFLDLNLLVKTVLGNFGRFDANLIYGRREVESNYASFFSFTDITIDTLGATPRYILERPVFGFNNKLTIGLDFYRDELGKDTFTSPSRRHQTYEAELTRETIGFYGRDEFSILPELILALGARAERAEVDGKEKERATGQKIFDDEKDHRGRAWEASLTYLIKENSKLWGKYATLYRFPSLDQQASYYAYPFDVFLTNLDKETGQSYELGTQLAILPELRFGITCYLIDMKDEISYNPVTYRNENLDKTRHRGIEFSLAWQFRNFLRATANYTLQEAYFRKGPNKDKDVPLVPNHMVNGALELDLPGSITIRPEIRYVSSQYFGSDNDNSAEKLNDYAIASLALRWHPEREFWGYVKPSAFVVIDNLLNKHYCSVGYETYAGLYYYPAPTINVRGGVSISF